MSEENFEARNEELQQGQTGPAPTAAEWDTWTPENKDAYLNEHPDFRENQVFTQPIVDPARPDTKLEPVERVPAEPEHIKGTPEAGMQRIKAGIKVLEGHSAARVGGSIIAEALYLLEEGYLILTEHHKA